MSRASEIKFSVDNFESIEVCVIGFNKQVLGKNTSVVFLRCWLTKIPSSLSDWQAGRTWLDKRLLHLKRSNRVSEVWNSSLRTCRQLCSQLFSIQSHKHFLFLNHINIPSILRPSNTICLEMWKKWMHACIYFFHFSRDILHFSQHYREYIDTKYNTILEYLQSFL